MFPTASPGQARGKPQGGATKFIPEAKLGGTSGGDRRETLWVVWGEMRFIQTTGEFNKCIGFFSGGGRVQVIFQLTLQRTLMVGIFVGHHLPWPLGCNYWGWCGKQGYRLEEAHCKGEFLQRVLAKNMRWISKKNLKDVISINTCCIPIID